MPAELQPAIAEYAPTAGARATKRPPQPRLLGPIIEAAGVVVISLVLIAVDVASTEFIALWGTAWFALLMLTRPDELDLGGQIKAVFVAALGLAAVSWLTPMVATVPVTAETLAVLAAAALLVALPVRVVSACVTRAASVRHVVLVGSASDVEQTVAELRRARGVAWRPIGAFISDGKRLPSREELPTYDTEDLTDSSLVHDAHAVIVLPSAHLSAQQIRRFGWQLEASSTQLLLGTGLLDVRSRRLAPTEVGSLGLLQVRPTQTSAVGALVKSISERLLSAAILLALAPVLITIAIAVRIDSPGSPVFRQQRVGRNARAFTMYKFRTMHVDAEARVAALTEHNEGAGGVLFKMREDPRVTRVGRVLRKYSLDELPQLINVVLGSMSLVGPRPALPREVSQYTVDPRRRLEVKPGLTGLWQVSGRSDLSWDESVRLDLNYVDNRSLRLDTTILLKTVGAVLNHRGAY